MTSFTKFKSVKRKTNKNNAKPVHLSFMLNRLIHEVQTETGDSIQSIAETYLLKFIEQKHPLAYKIWKSRMSTMFNETLLNDFLKDREIA